MICRQVDVVQLRLCREASGYANAGFHIAAVIGADFVSRRLSMTAKGVASPIGLLVDPSQESSVIAHFRNRTLIVLLF